MTPDEVNAIKARWEKNQDEARGTPGNELATAIAAFRDVNLLVTEIDRLRAIRRAYDGEPMTNPSEWKLCVGVRCDKGPACDAHIDDFECSYGGWHSVEDAIYMSAQQVSDLREWFRNVLSGIQTDDAQQVYITGPHFALTLADAQAFLDRIDTP